MQDATTVLDTCPIISIGSGFFPRDYLVTGYGDLNTIYTVAIAKGDPEVGQRHTFSWDFLVKKNAKIKTQKQYPELFL